VSAVVFYDENDNGMIDELEFARVPGVEVAIGDRSGRSEVGSGRVQITGVPAGSQSLEVRRETLPPFYWTRGPITVEVPQPEGAQAQVPLTLEIGGNRPKVYMAFGDSLTSGTGASPGADYPNVLQTRLVNHFGSAIVSNRGSGGNDSFDAVVRARRNLRGVAPAYTLVLYGTNDWNDPACKADPPCYTVDNLQTVLEDIRDFNSLPFLATLPPVNPERNVASRNEWIETVNDGIRTIAEEQGAFLVDLYPRFMQAGDLPSLFADHIHFNDEGYELLAEAFFEAIAHGRSAPGARALQHAGISVSSSVPALLPSSRP
jgi:lysophospholipase L1-like esterase